jgi:hypothetical protein
MKVFFHFENGRLSVDPYKLKIDQIDAEVLGSHGFDQTIQYALNLKVPLSLMGTQGNAMVNNLLSQANSKGMNIKLGETVNLAAIITGTIMNPKIEANLKNVAGNAVDNMKKQLEDLAKRKADSIKTVAKDTAKAIKNEIINSAKNDLKKQFLGDTTTKTKSTEEVIKNTGDKVKDGIKNIFGKKK